MSAIGGAERTISVDTTIHRSIIITFDHALQLDGAEAVRGTLSGFLYQDQPDAADSPIVGYGHAAMPACIPYGSNIQPRGTEFTYAGNPRKQTTAYWTRAAKKAVQKWCEENPTWWQA